MNEIMVKLGTRSYRVHIDPNSLETIAAESPDAVIITNVTLHRLYDPFFRKLFKKVTVLSIPDGERHKDLRTANLLFGQLIKARVRRTTTVIGIGGGVIGDLSGFVASAYMRGVPFVQIPTTLLAMVDSSVGGKVGVNHALGKNMIGAFYQPKSVAIDARFLKTLPEREMLCGLAEIVKYGLILDESFFYWIEEHWEEILSKQPAALQSTIRRSCEIKASIVEKDELDTGLRMVLNFGHTWGHAFEKLGGYRVLKHGEAVFLGMFAANHLSMQCGRLHIKSFERIDQFLKIFIPTIIRRRGVGQLLKTMSWKEFTSIVRSDKKTDKGQMRWVTLDHIGHASVNSNIKMVLVRKSFAYLQKQLI